MLAIFHMMHYFKKAVPDRVWIFNFCPIDDFLIVSPSLSLDQPAQQDTRLPYLG